MYHMKNWKADMHFQRISSLFFTVTEEVQVWQLPESLPEEVIKQALWQADLQHTEEETLMFRNNLEDSIP